MTYLFTVNSNLSRAWLVVDSEKPPILGSFMSRMAARSDFSHSSLFRLGRMNSCVH